MGCVATSDGPGVTFVNGHTHNGFVTSFVTSWTSRIYLCSIYEALHCKIELFDYLFVCVAMSTQIIQEWVAKCKIERGGAKCVTTANTLAPSISTIGGKSILQSQKVGEKKRSSQKCKFAHFSVQIVIL
jgi:hypothetical protein